MNYHVAITRTGSRDRSPPWYYFLSTYSKSNFVFPFSFTSTVRNTSAIISDYHDNSLLKRSFISWLIEFRLAAIISPQFRESRSKFKQSSLLDKPCPSCLQLVSSKTHSKSFVQSHLISSQQTQLPMWAFLEMSSKECSNQKWTLLTGNLPYLEDQQPLPLLVSSYAPHLFQCNCSAGMELTSLATLLCKSFRSFQSTDLIQ